MTRQPHSARSTVTLPLQLLPAALVFNHSRMGACILLTRRAGLIYIEASAKTGDNVEEAFLRTARSIYQNIQNGSLDLNAAGDVLLAVSCIVHIAAPLSHAFCACLPLLTAAPTRHRSRYRQNRTGRRGGRCRSVCVLVHWPHPCHTSRVIVVVALFSAASLDPPCSHFRTG